jgi:hypothetical protein
MAYFLTIFAGDYEAGALLAVVTLLVYLGQGGMAVKRPAFTVPQPRRIACSAANESRR